MYCVDNNKAPFAFPMVGNPNCWRTLKNTEEPAGLNIIQLPHMKTETEASYMIVNASLNVNGTINNLNLNHL